MGLIAHWPLDGNTNDYSGNENTPTIVGTVSDNTSGKIGNCKGFSIGSMEVDSTNLELRYNTTICFWVNVTAYPTNRYGIMETLYGAEIALNVGASGELQWYYGTSGSQAAPYTAHSTGNGVVEVNKWVHITLVRDINLNKTLFYKNGNLISERALSYIPSEVTNNILKIGKAYTGNLLGQLNDVRIYDHALSIKEIKEVYKTKVLHYSFNDFQEPTTNYLGDGISGYEAIYSPSAYTGATPVIVGTSNLETPIFSYNTAGTNYIYTHDYVLDDDLTTLSEKTVTFSLYIKRITTGATCQIRIYDDITSYTTTGIAVTTEFTRISITKTIGLNPTRIFVMLDNTGGGVYHFHSPQLEVKSIMTPFTPNTRTGIVRDNSGFGHDAVLVEANTPRWVKSEKIGSGSYDFGITTDVSNYLQCDVFNNPTDQITINIWLHPIDVGDYSRGFASKANDASGTNGWAFRTGWGDDVRFNVGGNSGGQAYVGVNNNLCMITGTYNSITGILNWYKNGVLANTMNLTPAAIGNSSNPLYVGYSSGTGYHKGTMEDFRIYATEFDVDDILELYQTRGQLDNTGNLHINEVNEASTILLVESQQLNVTTGTTFGTLTVLNQDITSFVESDNTLGNYRVEGWVYVSDVTYYPARFEFTIENNTKGVTGTFGTENNLWVSGWNKLLFIPLGYADAANAPWGSMSRLEVYKTGPTTGADTSQYVIFKDLRLVKNLDNSLIQGGMADSGIFNTRQVSEVGITDGLVGYWKLNGDAKDYSGNENHGTVVGPTVTSGLKNLSYTFNGTSQYINIPNTTPTLEPEQISVSIWVNMDTDAPIGRNIFFTKWLGYSFEIEDTTRKPYFRLNGPGDSIKGTALVLGEWTHLAATWKVGEPIRLYINGVDQGGTVKSTPITYTGGAVLNIGRYSGGIYFKGKLSDARIYNRVLTPEEVNTQYKFGLPNTGMQLSTNGTLYLNNETNEAL